MSGFSLEDQLVHQGQDGQVALGILAIGKGFNVANEWLTEKLSQGYGNIFTAKYQPSTFTFGTD